MRELLQFDAEFEIRNLVQAVETCAYPLLQWHHDRHLAVTAWYLLHEPRDRALTRLRRTIVRFNAHNDIPVARKSGYHETLTRAWLILVDGHVARIRAARSKVEVVNDVIRTFQNKFHLRRHYTADRILSWEARAGWVEPDLDPLERGPGAPIP